jgi:hypothetical protein
LQDPVWAPDKALLLGRTIQPSGDTLITLDLFHHGGAAIFHRKKIFTFPFLFSVHLPIPSSRTSWVPQGKPHNIAFDQEINSTIIEAMGLNIFRWDLWFYCVCLHLKTGGLTVQWNYLLER